MEDDTVFCDNCKRDIATANFLMHEVHCKRNIVLCEHCDEPVPRSELDEHYNEYHAPVNCDLCAASLEKEKLNNHKENDCPKRKVVCAFCELDMSHCDLQAHMESCGTRTEQCTKCGQYIMLKDQAKHEDSNCSFPESTNGVTQVKTQHYNRDRNQLARGAASGYNAFALDEFSRLLDDPVLAGLGQRGRPTPNNLRQQGRGSLHTNLHTRNDIQGTSRRRNTTTTANTKPGPATRDTKNLDRERGRTNRGGGAGASGPTGRTENLNGIDMDHLLAMHLATDLSDQETHPSNHTAADSQLVTDDIILPCEFCDELMSLDALLEHQVVCNPVIIPPSHGDNSEDDALPNNSPRRASRNPATRAQPKIVDNLSYLSAQSRLANPDPDNLHMNLGIDDDVMLPCEFCDNLFPEDVLVQHQAVCDVNTFSTPRSQSPVIPRNNNRSLGRQRGSRINPLPKTSNIRNEPRNTNNDDINSMIRESPAQTTPYRRQTNMQRARGRGAGPHIGSKYSSPNNRDRENNPTRWQGAADFDGPSERRRGSASRVHDTLDHLVQDPTYQPSLNLPARQSPSQGAHNKPLNQRSQNASNGYLGITGTSGRRINKPRVVEPQSMDTDFTEHGYDFRTRGQGGPGRSQRGTAARGRRPQNKQRRNPNSDP